MTYDDDDVSHNITCGQTRTIILSTYAAVQCPTRLSDFIQFPAHHHRSHVHIYIYLQYKIQYGREVELPMSV